MRVSQVLGVVASWVVVSQAVWASDKGVPDHFSDFVLFARDSISGQKSDFQGPIGTLGSVELVDFGIRTESQHRDRDQDEILSAIYAGGDFSLVRGEVALGGVTSGGNIRLQSCQIDGRAQASGVVSGTRSCPARRGVRNRMGALNPAPQLFQAQIEDAAYKLERAFLIKSPALNVEWITHKSFPYSLVLDARGDSHRKFVVRITGQNALKISGVTVYLVNGARAENIVYFFPEATQIVLTRSGSRLENGVDLGIPGTILAPKAELVSYSEKITGAAYVRKFNGVCGDEPTVQINAAPFESWSIFNDACSCGAPASQ